MEQDEKQSSNGRRSLRAALLATSGLALFLLAGCGMQPKVQDFGSMPKDDNAVQEKAQADYNAAAKEKALQAKQAKKAKQAEQAKLDEQAKQATPKKQKLFAGWFDKQPDPEPDSGIVASQPNQNSPEPVKAEGPKTEKAASSNPEKKKEELSIVERLDAGRLQYANNMKIGDQAKASSSFKGAKVTPVSEAPAVAQGAPAPEKAPESKPAASPKPPKPEAIIDRSFVGDDRPFGATRLSDFAPMSSEAQHQQEEERDRQLREERRVEEEMIPDYVRSEIHPSCTKRRDALLFHMKERQPDGSWDWKYGYIEEKTARGPMAKARRPYIMGYVKCLEWGLFGNKNRYYFFEKPTLDPRHAKVLIGPDGKAGFDDFKTGYKAALAYYEARGHAEQAAFDASLASSLKARGMVPQSVQPDADASRVTPDNAAKEKGSKVKRKKSGQKAEVKAVASEKGTKAKLERLPGETRKEYIERKAENSRKNKAVKRENRQARKEAAAEANKAQQAGRTPVVTPQQPKPTPENKGATPPVTGTAPAVPTPEDPKKGTSSGAAAPKADGASQPPAPATPATAPAAPTPEEVKKGATAGATTPKTDGAGQPPAPGTTPVVPTPEEMKKTAPETLTPKAGDAAQPPVTAPAPAPAQPSTPSAPAESTTTTKVETGQSFKLTAKEIAPSTVMPRAVRKFTPGHYLAIQASRAKRPVGRVMTADVPVASLTT